MQHGARGIRLDGTTGALTTVIFGMEENQLRLARTASADDALQLLVFRLPLATLSGVADEVFEIGEQHHYHLLSWAKRCALLKQDAETFDKNRSDDMEATFRAYCAQAKVEQGNKRHKVRNVSFGGI